MTVYEQWAAHLKTRCVPCVLFLKRLACSKTGRMENLWPECSVGRRLQYRIRRKGGIL